MRIGLVVPGFSADAFDWCIPALRDLVGELSSQDDVWVLALRYPGTVQTYSVFGASVTALGGGVKRGGQAATLWRDAFVAISGEHRRRRFDVLHAFWADETGSIVALAGRVLRVPTIVSVAGGELVGFRDIGYGNQLSFGGRTKVDLALRLADAVTGGSRFVLDLAYPRLANRPKSRVHLAPLGVDVRLFNQPNQTVPASRGREARFVHVASFVPVKDQATLLRAMARLKDTGAAFTLDLAGDGPLKETLQATAAQLRLTSTVRFLGPVAHDQLASVYRGASAFVLTSRHEAQCMAALEAAACGVPVLGTRVGVLPDMGIPTEAVVDIGDDEALAGALGRLISSRPPPYDPDRVALSTFEDRFRLDRCTDAIRAIYRDLVIRN